MIQPSMGSELYQELSRGEPDCKDNPNWEYNPRMVVTEYGHIRRHGDHVSDVEKGVKSTRVFITFKLTQQMFMPRRISNSIKTSLLQRMVNHDTSLRFPHMTSSLRENNLWDHGVRNRSIDSGLQAADVETFGIKLNSSRKCHDYSPCITSAVIFDR